MLFVQCQNQVLRELGYALLVGLTGGMAWKTWQWNDKARRIENNNAWDKYYPIYAQQVKVRFLTPNREHDVPLRCAVPFFSFASFC